MDVNKITDIKELKALAYDELLKRDQAERNLAIINQRIAEIVEAHSKTNKS